MSTRLDGLQQELQAQQATLSASAAAQKRADIAKKTAEREARDAIGRARKGD